MECKICYETIDIPVYYQLSETDELKIFDYCDTCLKLQLNNKWNDYIKMLKNPGCDGSLKRMLVEGPPRYYCDTMIASNHPIFQFTFNNQIISAKLDNNMTEVEFDTFCNNLSKALTHDDVINILEKLM